VHKTESDTTAFIHINDLWVWSMVSSGVLLAMRVFQIKYFKSRAEHYCVVQFKVFHSQLIVQQARLLSQKTLVEQNTSLKIQFSICHHGIKILDAMLIIDMLLAIFAIPCHCPKI